MPQTADGEQSWQIYTVLPFRGHPSPVPHHLPVDTAELTHSFDLNAYFVTEDNHI